MSKASNVVPVAKDKKITQVGPSPINVTVMAPYPPYDKSYSIYDGGNFGPANYQSNHIVPKPPPTPYVQPPTPLPPKQLNDIENPI